MSKKNLYIIKVLCNWDNSENLVRNWLCKMAENTDECQTDNIKFVSKTDTKPDYFVIFNKPLYDDEDYDPKKTIVIQLEPWCHNNWQNWGVKHWGVWSKPDPNVFVAVRNHSTYPNLLHWEIDKTLNQLKNEKIDKTSCISTITTSKYFDPGHKTRIDLLLYLESKEFLVDIYGYDNKFNFKGYKGPHAENNKNEGIIPYKYYIHCENNDEYNFITEKIWDSILSECVIFYWGCHNISDYVDPSCYILLHKDDHETNYQIIKKAIEEDEWGKRIDKIRKMKHRLLSNFNIFPIIKHTISGYEDTSIDIWLHACNKNHGLYILQEQLNRIKNTLLYTRLRKIHVCIVGPDYGFPEFIQGDKIMVHHISKECGVSEYASIKYLLRNYLDEKSYVLYLHTKGIKHDKNDKKIRDWREMMEYFLIDKWEECIELLKEYDGVGCDLQEQKNINNIAPTHFSGNFWWAKGEYLLKNKDRLGQQKYKYDSNLQSFVLDEKVDNSTFPSVEFWFATHPEAKLKCIHHSMTNHYLHEYDKTNYIPN